MTGVKAPVFICRYNRLMRWTQTLGAVLAGLALVGFIFVSTPAPKVTYTIPFSIDNVSQGTMLLTVPVWLKVGDTTEVSLQISFTPDEMYEVEVQQLDLISQLEIGFLELSPKGQGHFSVSKGNTIVLKWQIKPQVEADFSGTVWLFQQQPDQDTQLILGKGIEFPARKFLGFSYKTARIISLCGVVVGIILFLPSIWERLIKKRTVITQKI